jgi:YVTN family beta-propeller protein
MLNRRVVAYAPLLLALLVLAPGTTEAAGPPAYITNCDDNTVSVIDTASNTVTATVPVGACPGGVAVMPDGAHVYVANSVSATVSVITAASNTVTATVPVGLNPQGIAATPDGSRVYVANSDGNTVSVIATASNTVTATVPVPAGSFPFGIAITPDGAHAYVTSVFGSVSVIATASNTVTAVPVGLLLFGAAVAPDGAHVYVSNGSAGEVSVIATSSNTVTASVPVGNSPFGVAVTPDGARVYVANQSDNTVSVIDTATNIVTATVPVGRRPIAFGRFIGPSSVPFASFTARVEIDRSHRPTKRADDSFEVQGSGVLGPASNGISPSTEIVTLSLGSFSLTIPAGSFVATRNDDDDDRDDDRDDDDDCRHCDTHHGNVTTYRFKGVIAGVSLDMTITVGAARTFSFQVEGRNADLHLVVNPVTVGLSIGDDAGQVVVKADIDK